MSLLRYNGITLAPVKMVKWTRTPIYDGPRYLYTEHELAVRATYSPEATSYVQGGGNGLASQIVINGAPGGQFLSAQPRVAGLPQQPPVGQSWNTSVTNPTAPAPTTDYAIRHRLMTPRQQLQYGMLAMPLLYSPMPGFNLDCQNGPQPQAAEVVAQTGPRTWEVVFVVKTWVNENVLQYGAVSPVLSSQYESEDTLDEDFYTSRTYTGRLVLRSDVLDAIRRGANGAQQADLRVDDFRYAALPPVAGSTMQRKEILVHEHADGLTLDWRVTDQENTRPLDQYAVSRNVTRIEAFHKRSVNSGNVENLVKGLVLGAVGGAYSGQSTTRKWKTKLGSLGVIAAGAAAGALVGAAPALPTALELINVKVFGNRNATRIGLEEVANAVVANRNTLSTRGTVMDYDVTHSLHENAVEVSATLMLGGAIKSLIAPVANFFAGLIGFSPAQPPVWSTGQQRIYFSKDEENTKSVWLDKGANSTQPAPPSDSRSRGTFLERLVAQVLDTADLAPSATLGDGGPATLGGGKTKFSDLTAGPRNG